MPKILTQSQVDHFHEYGYCAPIDVMSEDEAHALKLRVEAAEAANPEELGPTNRNNAHLAFTCIDEVAHHPVIVGAESRQTNGEPLVQVVQGCDSGGDFTVLPRPDTDRDEAGVAARAQANANWAEILYAGASKVRAY